jgi:two-component system, NarL family, nitrate/nitrite response regulator NarL
MTDRPIRLRVLIAENHPLFRDALAGAVRSRPALDLISARPDGATALEEIKKLAPDVAVLDVKMPGLDGMAVLNAVIRKGLVTRVIFLTAYLDNDLVYRALEGGAAGYLSKDTASDAICDAISAVGRGETVLPDEVHGGLVSEIRMRRHDDRPVLTAREQEILELTAHGHSAPEMGQRLYLSPGTVKTHLQHVYRKLEVSDRAAAVAEGMRRGLIE